MMSKYVRHTSSTRYILPFLSMMLGLLLILASCGSNGTDTGSPAPSTAPTAAPTTAPTAAPTTAPAATATPSGGGYGYSKYGNPPPATPTAAPSTSGAGATGSGQTIVMSGSSGFAFTPSTLTISVGTTITWRNATGAPHTVTSDDGTSFHSDPNNPVGPGGTYSFKFTKAGTYAYHCEIHPSMTATIIVK